MALQTLPLEPRRPLAKANRDKQPMQASLGLIAQSPSPIAQMPVRAAFCTVQIVMTPNFDVAVVDEKQGPAVEGHQMSLPDWRLENWAARRA